MVSIYILISTLTYHFAGPACHGVFSVLLTDQGCKVLVDIEAGVVVPTTIRNHFTKLQVLNLMGASRLMLQPMASKWLQRAETSKYVVRR